MGITFKQVFDAIDNAYLLGDSEEIYLSGAKFDYYSDIQKIPEGIVSYLKRILRKFLPRKAVLYGSHFNCPTCGNKLIEGAKHCSNCAQKINWNKEELLRLATEQEGIEMNQGVLENTTNLDKLIHMLNMQKIYDSKVMHAKGIEEIDPNAAKLALLDEIGELNHELKGVWCWWKSTQKKPEMDKVLEELIDCWHFAMNRYLTYADADDPTPFIKTAIQCYTPLNFDDISIKRLSIAILDIAGEDEVSSLRDIIHLSELLGFSFDEIYNAYIKKNVVNHERLKNNY